MRVYLGRPNRCASLLNDAAVAQMRLDADGPALNATWAEGRHMDVGAATDYAVALDGTNR